MIIKSASDFVDSVLQIWPPFRWDEVQEKAWTQLMVRNLDGFKPAVLDRAFQDMVARRKETRIPTPAECIAACTEAKRWLEMETNDGKLPGHRIDPHDEWSTERCRLAHDLKRSDIGKQAAREGWIVSFWHFCRRHQRVPNGREIDQCKQDSAGIDELYGKAMRGECGPMSEALANLGHSILDKRRKWSEEAMGR